MEKLSLLFFCLALLISAPLLGRACYPPKDNAEIAGDFGEILYQEFPDAWIPRRDLLIVKDNQGEILVLRIVMGDIEAVRRLNKEGENGKSKNKTSDFMR